MISYARIVKGSNAELIAHKKTRLISVILLAFAALIYGCATSSRGDSVNPSPLGLFIYFAALVPLFSCCSDVFKDMHDIPTADVQMSMPLSSTERYFSRLLTVCRIWLIPFFISAAAAIGLSLIFGGSHYSKNPYFQNDYSEQYHPDVMLKYNFHLLLWFLAAVLFIIAVTVVCQCCIGTKAESKYLPVLMMIVLSSFAPALHFFITDKFADVSIRDMTFVYSIWTFSALSTDFESVKDTVLLGVNCLISLGVIFGGMYLCRKRDARTVGRPIVFPLFFEVIMALSLCLFFILFHSDMDSLVVMFLGWLGSIILRIVVSRKKFSFAKIGIWTGMFFGYYLVFLLFMYIAFLTNGFGCAGMTPEDNAYDKSKCSVDITVSKVRRFYSNAENNFCDLYIKLDCRDNSGSLESVKDFTGTISDAARRQNRINGLFSYKMFGGYPPTDSYKCSITISMYDDEPSWRSSIYSADFYVNREDAQNIAQEAYRLDMAGY